MSNSTKCHICGGNATVDKAQGFFGDFIHCERCGKVIVESSALEYLKGDDGYKYSSSLYYHLTHHRKYNKKTYLIVDSEEKNDDYNTVTIKELVNLYPKTFSEKIDMILLNLSSLSGGLGKTLRLILDVNYIPVFMANDKEEANFISSIIRKEFEYLSGNGAFIGNVQECKLTFKAWQRIDELQKQIAKYKKGFIAMWFDEKMNPTREAIKEVFIETGCQISIIDEKHHNNQIVPEILHEIETNDFIIADLTGNLNGVYYEAGYALGQGKKVILTVNQNEIEEDYDNASHFDVAQINQIRYENLNDLKVQLFNRITSTVGNIKDPNAKLRIYNPNDTNEKGKVNE